ncbi:hypothetical protein Lbir_2285 [Legionella birminghamensis]|uniref:Glycosyltransferase n=1 Tax=Legionella birminghamensis TaxID=28083 RepID=A0A378I5X9_9GAMM|nr:glycosyltransferase family 1 protein [Legionella birminghamensis]KTC68752.1 hypothetical protein Lbir_2285 [Legionella birminghamensis]STX30262.1 Uncharacterised protein [Legionella birminghamensis]
MQAFHNSFSQFKSDSCSGKPSYWLRKKRKIAIVLPLAYGGGNLKGACLLAETLLNGSRQCNEEAEIIITCLKEQKLYGQDLIEELPEEIKIRQYQWDFIDASAAEKAMYYAGHTQWQPTESLYSIFDDKMNFLSDCDLWLIISDRVQAPILPLRPYVMMIYNYIERYIPGINADKQVLISNAQKAKAVLTTTNQTYQDAMQYGGISKEKLHKLPILLPHFKMKPEALVVDRNYFLWPTNEGAHKNNFNGFQALKYYYEELEGSLECHITGINSAQLAEQASISSLIEQSDSLKSNIHFFSNLNEKKYQAKLVNASFLWHPTKIDNGAFSVIEAALYNVPSLSSSYPAMQEIDNDLKLHLTWMDANNPNDMGRQLKWMEANREELKNNVESANAISNSHSGNFAVKYWKVIRECL